jgi:hypothetical protein
VQRATAELHQLANRRRGVDHVASNAVLFPRDDEIAGFRFAKQSRQVFASGIVAPAIDVDVLFSPRPRGVRDTKRLREPLTFGALSWNRLALLILPLALSEIDADGLDGLRTLH